MLLSGDFCILGVLSFLFDFWRHVFRLFWVTIFLQFFIFGFCGSLVFAIFRSPKI